MALLLRQGVRTCRLTTVDRLCSNPKILTACVRPLADVASKDGESFWDKNKRLHRPISPHLTVYKWEMTMNMSLVHRTTGLIMTSGVYGFALATLMLPSGTIPQFLNVLQQTQISPTLVFATKFLLAFPLTFHLCSGLRHLNWDMGNGFSIKSLYATGYAAIGTSLALAALVASL